VSSRAIAGSFDIFAQWSIRPERILEVLFPNFLGRPDTLAAADYWGTKIEDFGFPYILSLYFGLPVLILVIAGIQRNRLHLALLIAAVVAILFSLGRFFPITRVLYELVPGISHFRYPVKFFCLALVPISYLAAAGFEKHWVDKTSLTKGYILTALWLATAVMILFFLLLNVQNFMDSFVRSFFKLPLTAQMHAGLMNSVFHMAIISFLLSLVYTLHKFRMAQWHRFVIFGILAVDLMIAGKNLNPLAPVSFYETPEAVHLVRKELRGGKFYRTPNPPGIVLNAPSNDVIWQYRWNLEVLSEHLGTSYAIPMIFHGDIDGLAQKRLIDLTTVLNQLPWQKRLPILSAAGVTVIMTHEKLNVPGVQPAYVLRNRSNVPFFIYRNRGAIVPAARVRNLVKIKGLQGTINFLISPDFTPDRCAVTDEDFNKPFGCLEKGGSVKFLRSSYRQMEYQTSGNCKDVLALNLPFYKGWQVFIDGNESKLSSINWAFSGIQVPANSHQLLLRYSPNSVKIGAIITLVSITVLLTFTVTINYAVRKA
ncbi:MAG TPA: YfhO family protein, partial [Acidobacteriota bacterium]|nr:YfhO family protein [Acidobacteriota bacterium]